MRTLVAILELVTLLEQIRGPVFRRMATGAPCTQWFALGTLLALLPVTAVRQAAAQTFGAPAALNANAATDSEGDSSPQVTTDGAGTWVAVWRSNDPLSGTIGYDGDILVARSNDAGESWTAPVALNTNAATDLGDDYAPQVTTDGAGTWVTVWCSNDSLGGTIGTDHDILVSRSHDNGATWSAPVALNTNAATDSGDDFVPQLTTDGLGDWVAVWSSSESLGGTIGADRDILVTRSGDAGETWTAPEALNTNAATDSARDGEPQVTTDSDGNWVAVWDSWESVGGILVARSSDAGETWTAPDALGVTPSGVDYEPQVTTDGAGNWVAVWASASSLGGTIGDDFDILVARSADAGETWTAPMALNTNAATDWGTDRGPQVATDGAGNWVAVWSCEHWLYDELIIPGDIFVARSNDTGLTWQPPALLKTDTPPAGEASDSGPQLTTAGGGNWLAVWNSNDSLGDTIGYDFDILFAIGTAEAPVPTPILSPWLRFSVMAGLLGAALGPRRRQKA